MKEKHIYKHLPAYGFFGAFILILLSVHLLNQYWTGLGENPKTILMPEISKDYEEFKDYATLLIALLSFCASLISSLFILLFYGSWKEQHNKNIETAYYQEAIDSLKNVSSSIHEIKRIADELNMDYEGRSDIISDKYICLRNQYIDNLSKLQSTILFIDLMEENNNLEKNIYPFISNAKLRIQKLDLERSTLERMDYDVLIDHIQKESTFHGYLIKDNIKNMLTYLYSRVKA